MPHRLSFFLALGACAASETAHQDAVASQASDAPETAVPIAASWLAREEITGSLEPLAAVQLGFDVPGRLSSIEVQRGQTVATGAAIARLDDAMARAQLQQAEAALASAKAQRGAAEAGWTRTQELKDAGGLSDQQFADAEAGTLAVRAGAEQAAAAVALARTNLAHHTLRAPFAGVVTSAPDNAGAMVGAGTPLFVIEDLASLQVKGTVPETTTWVEAGQPVQITAGAVTAAGEVVRVIPSLDPVTRRIPVEVVVKNPPPGLHAHAFVRVRLQATTPMDAVKVPKAALVARPDFSVFTWDGTKAARVPVQVLGDDPDAPDLVVVQGALASGLPVVLNPPSSL